MRKKDTTKIISLGVAAVVIATGLLWLWQDQQTVEPVPTPPIVVPIEKPPAPPPSIGEGPPANQPQPVYPPDVVEITPPPPAPPSVGEEPSPNQPQPVVPEEEKEKPKPNIPDIDKYDPTLKPNPVGKEPKKPCCKSCIPYSEWKRAYKPYEPFRPNG